MQGAQGICFRMILTKSDRFRGTADRPNRLGLRPRLRQKASGSRNRFGLENHPSQIKAAPCMAERCRPLCLAKLPSDPTIQNNRNRTEMSFKMLYFSDRLIIHPNRISYYNKIARAAERCKKVYAARQRFRSRHAADCEEICTQKLF